MEMLLPSSNSQYDEFVWLISFQVIRPAAVIYVVFVMFVSLCYEYWHFMLC